MSRELDVQKLAYAYRRLVLWFGASVLIGILRTAEFMGFESWAPAMADTAGAIVTSGALAYYGFLVATVLGSKAGWVWGVAMFVPCANLISLGLLSSKATIACTANGIKVGFLGPIAIQGADGPGE